MSKSRYNNPKRLTNSCNKGLKLEWEEILPKHKHELRIALVPNLKSRRFVLRSNAINLTLFQVDSKLV